MARAGICTRRPCPGTAARSCGSLSSKKSRTCEHTPHRAGIAPLRRCPSTLMHALSAPPLCTALVHVSQRPAPRTTALPSVPTRAHLPLRRPFAPRFAAPSPADVCTRAIDANGAPGGCPAVFQKVHVQGIHPDAADRYGTVRLSCMHTHTHTRTHTHTHLPRVSNQERRDVHPGYCCASPAVQRCATL